MHIDKEMSKNNNSNDSGIGCLLGLMLAIIAMPLLGLFLAVAGEKSEQKMLGVVLLIVGIMVWAKIGV